MLELILLFLGAMILAPTAFAITCFLAMAIAQIVTIVIAFPTFLIAESIKSTVKLIKGS